MDNESREMFQKLFDKLDKMDNRFDMVDSRLDKMDDRFAMVDSRLDKMDDKFKIMELKQDRTSKKLEDLRLDIAVAERDIRRDIHDLKDEMETVIEILKLNDMLSIS